MMFEYKCRICGAREITTDRADSLGRCKSVECNGELRRLFSFHTAGVHPRTRFKEHKNATTGLPTSSMHQFKDDLKRLGEAATLRTGVEHNYQPIDRQDRAAAGVSEHAEEHLARNREQARKDRIAKLTGKAA